MKGLWGWRCCLRAQSRREKGQRRGCSQSVRSCLNPREEAVQFRSIQIWRCGKNEDPGEDHIFPVSCPLPRANPTAHQGSGSPLSGQVGRWSLPQAGGVPDGSQSPGRGTTLVDGTCCSFFWPCVPVARIRGLRDAPFIAHSTAPSKPEITAPPILGALEVGWNGDPWGLEGVQEEAGYLGTLPSPSRLH